MYLLLVSGARLHANADEEKLSPSNGKKQSKNSKDQRNAERYDASQDLICSTRRREERRATHANHENIGQFEEAEGEGNLLLNTQRGGRDVGNLPLVVDVRILSLSQSSQGQQQKEHDPLGERD